MVAPSEARPVVVTVRMACSPARSTLITTTFVHDVSGCGQRRAAAAAEAAEFPWRGLQRHCGHAVRRRRCLNEHNARPPRPRRRSPHVNPDQPQPQDRTRFPNSRASARSLAHWRVDHDHPQLGAPKALAARDALEGADLSK
jgi:hypothetical protein